MSATVSRPTAGRWLAILLRGRPHQVVGPPGHPYLLRWFVVPHNKFLNVYVHKFTASDEPQVLHDHPWWFASLVLSGSYVEHTTAGRAAGGAAVSRCGRRRFGIASNCRPDAAGSRRCAGPWC